jgi:hypothetical protein
MVTIDLRRHASDFREPVDEATAARVAELLCETPRVRKYLADLARRELARMARLPARDLGVIVEPTVRVDGVRILIDGDAVAVPRDRTGST